MNFKKYISVALFAALLSACSSDFLTKVPEDSINTSNFFQTEADAIAAINGAYQPLQWPKLYNMRMWTTDIMAGNSIVGAGGGTDGIETQDEANFITSTDNQGVLDLWRGPWPGILRTNIILQKVPGMSISENVKNRVLGEAYFLRAHYYFILVRFFGDVPLVLTPVTPGDDLRPSRAPKADVYTQIISDLNKAIELLPTKEEYSTADLGRATKGAAVGTLAKVYLTLGNWQQTVDLCDQVKTLGYSLNANYGDNFNPATENSQESLFEVQHSGKTTFDFWSNENQASWLSTFTGPRGSNMVDGGWGWNQPTQEFVDSYETGDKRKDVTVFYEGCPKFDGQDYKKAYSLTGYNLRKFVVTKTVTGGAYDNSPLNFPVLRYADVLLMKAEALNELGRTTDAQLASTDANATLNKVRARAGLADVVGLSQNDLRNKILHERRMELAFEGQRWFDLIRVQNGQYGIDFLHSIGKSNMSSKFLLMPVPQKERDANPNLTQNTGY
ncbi:RagB/SusD family nutrient uptake outer membrane protein [Parabacteroides sp. FAFU027]|uniref:RagB/SusD family nutrient uptake outer membrane protein n=1 Tax=Parabacteroides sp. FAFU027 TaxID=2922715 RepID=UPI001FAFDCD7|nr:RagB/SusD family nutrient uptake outer membrane protein [Parabacteroides sp. FAFU027]